MINALKCVRVRVRKVINCVVNLVRFVLRFVSATVILVYLLPLIVSGSVLYGLPRTLKVLTNMFTDFRSSPRKWPSEEHIYEYTLDKGALMKVEEVE